MSKFQLGQKVKPSKYFQANYVQNHYDYWYNGNFNEVMTVREITTDNTIFLEENSFAWCDLWLEPVKNEPVSAIKVGDYVKLNQWKNYTRAYFNVVMRVEKIVEDIILLENCPLHTFVEDDLEKVTKPENAIFLGGMWDCLEDMVDDFRDNSILECNILLAYYSYEDWSGEAFVLYEKDGKLYDVYGSHCSCYGLENQWNPEVTDVETLFHQLKEGRLGRSYTGENKYCLELVNVLNKWVLRNEVK